MKNVPRAPSLMRTKRTPVFPLLSYPGGMSLGRREVLGNCRNGETFPGRQDQRVYFLAEGAP